MPSTCTASAARSSSPPTRARIDGEERFIAQLEEELGDATDPATVESFEQAAPPEPALHGARALLAEEGGMSQTVELPRVGGPGSGLDDNWRVIVLNDNHNTFEGVAFALSSTLPGVSYDAGMSMANDDPQQGPGDRLDGRARARRALLGAAEGRGAHYGAARAGLTASPAPTISQNVGSIGTW